MTSEHNPFELGQGLLYLPQPRELLEVSSGLAALDAERNAKTVLLELALRGHATAEHLSPVRNISAPCEVRHSLTEKQRAYDRYFGVERIPGNPAAVLCEAIVHTYALLITEKRHGHTLNATELGHLAAGMDTVLQLLAGPLNSEKRG